MFEVRDKEREIRQLLVSGLAQDREQAVQILDEMDKKRKRGDLLIFYSDVHRARECFGTLIANERPYNHTAVSVADVFSGAMSQAIKGQVSTGNIAIGALKEFVVLDKIVIHPKDGDVVTDEEARLVAFVRKFPFRGKSGIFFSSWSADEVHLSGKETVDEKENLARIEFTPIAGDYVLGMFHAWSQQPESKALALVLYMAKSRTMSF